MVPHAHSDQKEAQTLFQTPAGGARGRIHAERVHYQAAAEGALRPTEPQRPTSEDLVSEPQDEEEETHVKGASFGLLLKMWDIER